MRVTLDSVNSCIREDAESYIALCEKSYSEKITEVAEKIVSENGRTLLMLAGPSGSGKTTTALMLRKKLQQMGRNAITISLDDFYCEDNLNYTFEDGTVDYETIKALDEKLIGECRREVGLPACTAAWSARKPWHPSEDSEEPRTA